MDLSRCLAYAPAGAELTVRHIPFETIRAYCDDVGLHEGDHVVAAALGPDRRVLRTADGDRIAVPTPYALMIEVDAVAPLVQRAD